MLLVDVIVIVFFFFIFMGVLVYFLLGEVWGFFDVLVIFLCFIGVVLIVRLMFLFVRYIELVNEESDFE